MKITEIMSASDSFTDEVCTETWARTFTNQAISKINMFLGTSLPLLQATDSEYSITYLPDDWQYALLVTHVNYGVKMNDTSLNEADRYLQEFNEYLKLLKSRMNEVIDDEFLKPSGNGDEDTGNGGVYVLDTSEAIDQGWFKYSNRGGN